ncbi:MAG: sigma-70 family RNA polymerase sigma factor [Acidobacteria bacterium]|nr:sigma-70 family RNA polymerase sigma factor [Acidobacteriota bacterium]MBK8811151.1 sigma-70 family RNA polymerase sigma factor [Acidobacteriota bacterium]
MPQDVTLLLDKINDGDVSAPEILLPLVYDELRKLANSYLKKERSDHTLQATALVHEAYIRLVDWENVSWQNRAHFFAVAAQVMRHILVDHARRKKADIHGGRLQKLALEEAISFSKNREIDLVDLDDALKELEKLDQRQSRIVELRFFAGLTIEETAHALSVSTMTVSRDWNFAKAWLFRRLENDG